MPKTRAPLAGVVAMVVSITCVSTVASGGQKVLVGGAVAQAQRVSIDQIDHVAWDKLLKTYVDQNGRVDYARWQRASGDERALDDYLRELSRADTKARSSHEAKLAYWINAYNAVTIKGILREYPTDSIRNHTAKLYGYNIWHDLLLVVGDSKISLNDIEHEVLRKSGDFRIHFAIVCASHSCPRLLNEAYVAARLDSQLDANTQVFFANQENFQYRNGTFYLSAILKWYADDFGSTTAGQLKAIARYLPDRASQQLATEGRGRVAYLAYRWNLNDQATARKSSR